MMKVIPLEGCTFTVPDLDTLVRQGPVVLPEMTHPFGGP